MNSRRTHKKNLIVRYENLSDELKAKLKELYPEGHTDYLQRFEKPNGETIFVVPMETEDTMYMVKFDVKIDSTLVDADLDKDLYGDSEEKGEDDEFGSMDEAMDKDEGNVSHNVTEVRHGACEIDTEDEVKKKKKKADLAALSEELNAAFADEFGNDEEDSYEDDDKDEDKEEDEDGALEEEERDESEPTDEELMDIDSEIFKNAEIPPEELARMEAEGKLSDAPRKRGRPRKYPPAPEKPKTGKRGRPKKNQ